MKVTINVIYDFSFGVLTHNTIPPPIPVPSPSFEMIATQMWTLGYLAGQNKLTTTVKHNRVYIVQEGHDCGMMIPDVTPVVFANAYYAVMWPMSSRKVMFSASTVKMDKVATGCAQMIGLPPLPMMTCGDPVSMPTAHVCPAPQLFHSVTVGMTWLDLVLGLLTIMVSIVLDVLFYEPAGANIGWEILGKVIGNSPKSLAKRAVAAVAGFAISVLGEWASGRPPGHPDFNPTFRPGLGGPLSGVDPVVTPFSPPGQPGVAIPRPHWWPSSPPSAAPGAAPAPSAAPGPGFGGGGAGHSFGEGLP